MLLGLAVMGAAHVEAARSFNGTSDSLVSASTVDLSAYNKLTVSMWVYLNANSGIQMGFEVDSPTSSNTVGALNWLPYHSTFTASAPSLSGNPAPANNNLRTYPAPSAAAWHHIVLVYDTTRATLEINAAYVDSALQTLTTVGSDFNNTMTFANKIWYFASRANSSLWMAGRLAEIAFWGGYAFTQTDVNALYNGGAGTPATNVQPGSLVNYWRVLGNDSPEPATVGSVSLTVNGTTQVAHPIGLGAAPTGRVPKGTKQR